MAFSTIEMFLPLLVFLTLQGNVVCLSGSWKVLIKDAGISSMHSVVTHYDTVVLLDRKMKLSGRPCDDGVSNSGHCIVQSKEYHPATNRLRPLGGVSSDTWCSSGQFGPNGTLIQTGGYGNGGQKVRYFTPCTGSAGGHQQCQWMESKEPMLKVIRWYSTNQLLPDGTQIVMGGIGGANYEYFPRRHDNDNPTDLPLLKNSNKDENNGYYPFLHLLPDGSLFILAGTNCILLDTTTNKPKKTLPPIPGNPRTYPSGGSSVMLTLHPTDRNSYVEATILVCGGSAPGAYWAKGGANMTAMRTCGKITPTNREPSWEIEYMPFARTMGDMVMLPTQDVLIINGATKGSQGYQKAAGPALHPVIYSPSKPAGRRFELQNPSAVPRMYHSTANLLPDGRVLVAGSNTHTTYVFDGDFPSELRLEAFSPGYLDSGNDKMRVRIERIDERVSYGGVFSVAVSGAELSEFEVNLMSAPFATHSFLQGQRLVNVNVVGKYGQGTTVLKCKAPPRAEVAPPGYYMVFVVNGGIPCSSAGWVKIIT